MKGTMRYAAAIFGGALLASVAMSPVSVSAVESTDPIKLTIHDWTGQYLTTPYHGRSTQAGGLQHPIC